MTKQILPLKIHSRLPFRPWAPRFYQQLKPDYKFTKIFRLISRQTWPANQFLFENAEIIQQAYNDLKNKDMSFFFPKGSFPSEIHEPLDPLISDFVMALNKIKGIKTWESCQGLFHNERARLTPHISYHPLGARMEEEALAKIAHFIRWGPQDTYYLWTITCHEYYGRLVHTIEIPLLETDPEILKKPWVPYPKAFRTISQKVYDRVIKDINTLTLTLLFLQHKYGDNLDNYPEYLHSESGNKGSSSC